MATITNDILDFVFTQSNASIIKVIGVGGGGGNAVSHMYKEGINDVSFVLCNTDNQALNKSTIPYKIQLGMKTTEGLGAGNRPERARDAAEESLEDINLMLDDGTKMVFITAGMGGGTGTGAAPVVARLAKEKDILTVGIVTIPFLFEGEPKIIQALNGVEEMSKYVDALLVINNERLRSIYPDLNIRNAFEKADDTLTVAAKSIAEIITNPGIVNLDFADVRTILKDGGVAIMSTGYGEGDRRVELAIEDALNSPLLNNNNPFGARKVLFNLYSSEQNPVKMEEMAQVHEFMNKFDQQKIEVIWGVAIDNSLGDSVKLALLATGFEMSNIPGMVEKNEKIRKEQEAIDQEEQRKREEMIRVVYGSAAVANRGRLRPKPVILSNAQLDDDAVIEQLEQTPAYNRETSFVNKFATHAQTPATPTFIQEKKAPEAPKLSDNKIVF
jgi:cell division protein FtsZ